MSTSIFGITTLRLPQAKNSVNFQWVVFYQYLLYNNYLTFPNYEME